MKKYLPGEFGRMVGVSYQTLLRWEEQKKLIPDYTETGRRYYTEQHMERYLNRNGTGTEVRRKVMFRKFL